MTGSPQNSERGSLLLVVLCLLIVLGIGLATFLALSNQAMKLSNRSFQISASNHLAESGLETALLALNTNDWSAWTNASGGALASTDTRAYRTITFANTKYGRSGMVGSIKLRVDNYNINLLNSVWTTSTAYRVGDLVGDAGVWYRCIKAHISGNSTRPVNWNYWIPEGIDYQWLSSKTYAADDLVVRNEVWYRCKATASGAANGPPNNTYWQRLESVYTTAPGWPYVSSSGQEALVISTGSGGAFTRLVWQNSTWGYNYGWRWRSTSYAFGDVVYYDGIWYRCVTPHTNNGSWTYSVTNGTAYWVRVDSSSSWGSSATYNIGDVVYHSATSSWYRCIRKNSGQTPSSSSAYWSNSPGRSVIWDSVKAYAENDTVLYNGVWYLSQTSINNYGRNPELTSGYWLAATDTASRWNSTTNFTAGTYKNYGGIWYYCVTGGINKSPNNLADWMAAGAAVIYSQGTATLPDNTAPIRTQIRASAATAAQFPNAAGATGGLIISGSSPAGTVDSYNSNTGTYASQNGSPGNAATNYSAVLAGGTSLAINNTTNVKGFLSWPSPPAGISSATTVWSPTDTTPTLVNPARVSRSPNIPQFDITAVPGGWPLTTNAVNSFIGTPGATTPSVFYFTGNASLPAGYTVSIAGPVILTIQGDLQISGAGAGLQVLSTGSLELHVTGNFNTDSASNGIDNQTLDPKKVSILLSKSTAGTFNYSSAASKPFYGVIYLPKSSSLLTIGNGTEIYGALSAQNITFSGTAKLHYDTALRYTPVGGVDQPYSIVEWRELTDPIEQVTLP